MSRYRKFYSQDAGSIVKWHHDTSTRYYSGFESRWNHMARCEFPDDECDSGEVELHSVGAVDMFLCSEHSYWLYQ